MLAESSGSVSLFKVNCLQQHSLNRIIMRLFSTEMFQLTFLNLFPTWSQSSGPFDLTV